MTLPLLLTLAGLTLVALGFRRGMPLALLVGAVLLTDAVAAYIILGPAAEFVHSLFHPGS